MSRSNFPLIEACGLKAHQNLNINGCGGAYYWVYAESLEGMLEAGVKVYGWKDGDELIMGPVREELDTHSGIVVALKELKPKSELDEAREIIEEILLDKSAYFSHEVFRKAKQFLEKHKPTTKGE